MAFIVTHTAPIKLAVSQAWLKGRCFPQLKWFRWLNVIVVIYEQRLIRLTFALPKDYWRTRSVHNLNFKAARLEHFADKRSAFLQSQILRADTWLGNQPGKFIKAFIKILFQI